MSSQRDAGVNESTPVEAPAQKKANEEGAAQAPAVHDAVEAAQNGNGNGDSAETNKADAERFADLQRPGDSGGTTDTGETSEP